MVAKLIWVDPEVLYGADLTALARMAIPVFANAAARTTAIPSPTVGQYAYLTDGTGRTLYNGTAWVADTATSPIYSSLTRLAVASSGNVTLSGIPSTLAEVRINWSLRSDVAGSTAQLSLRVNGDASAVYSYHYFTNTTGSTTTSNNNAADTSAPIGSLPAAGGPAGMYLTGSLTFTGWSATHAHVACTFASGAAYGSGGVAGFLQTGFVEYGGAAPFTSVTFMPSTGNFTAGSEFHVIGTY
jgi:hypothetical protein